MREGCMWSKSTVFITRSSEKNRNFPLRCLTHAHSHSHRASLYAAPERWYRVLNLTAMCPVRALIFSIDTSIDTVCSMRCGITRDWYSPANRCPCGRALNGQKNRSRLGNSTFQITTIRSATAHGTEHDEDMCLPVALRWAAACGDKIDACSPTYAAVIFLRHSSTSAVSPSSSFRFLLQCFL